MIEQIWTIAQPALDWAALLTPAMALLVLAGLMVVVAAVASAHRA